MPQKIMMNLSPNPSNAYSMASLNAFQKSVASPLKLDSLKTPMIGRIHSIRPGCGTCGRG